MTNWKGLWKNRSKSKRHAIEDRWCHARDSNRRFPNISRTLPLRRPAGWWETSSVPTTDTRRFIFLPSNKTCACVNFKAARVSTLRTEMYWYFVRYFCAYDQYNKTDPALHNTILFIYLFIYLFIFCVYLLPDMFRQVTMPLYSTDMFQYTGTRNIRPDNWDIPQHKLWNYIE
jgi:hypothetical protein